MFSVKDDTITVTRGDTLRVEIELQDVNGEKYNPSENDIVRIKAKRAFDKELSINKEIDHNSMIFELSSEECSNLLVGDYYYDLVITFENGDVNTPINYGKIIVRSDV